MVVASSLLFDGFASGVALVTEARLTIEAEAPLVVVLMVIVVKLPGASVASAQVTFPAANEQVPAVALALT